MYGFPLALNRRIFFCFSIGCIIFILIQFNVFFPPWDFLFDTWIVSGVWLCFQMADIFLLPLSFPSLIPMWSENTLCRLWILVPLLRFVYWPVIWVCFSMVYLGTWKECILFWSRMFGPCSAGLVINVEFISLCVIFFCLVVLSVVEKGVVEGFGYNCDLNSSFQFCQFLPYIFRST